MAATYQVWLKNQDGERIELLTDETGPQSGIGETQIRSLYLTHLENHAGIARLIIDGRSRLVSLFETDCQVEIYRRVLNTIPASDWYLEWEGMFVGEERRINETSDKSFTAHFAEYNDLLNREEISYYAGSAFTDKSGAGETVIKDFVYENIGAGAGVSVIDGRLYSGVRPGLSIQTDYGRGSDWTGKRSWKKLGKVIADIAQETGIAFAIVGTGPVTFEFQVYTGREGERGQDRSNYGLVAATGLNAAGNPPIIFSDKRRNMKNVVYSRHHGSEVNTVVVLGPGDDDEREITLVENDAAIVESVWNRRVDSINASQEDTEDGRTARGNEELTASATKETFNFEPIQSPSLSYGVHYSWGDTITGQIDDVVRHKKLIGVKITLNQDGEKIDHDFADVVRY